MVYSLFPSILKKTKLPLKLEGVLFINSFWRKKMNANRSNCIGCGNKLIEIEDPFCLFCEKVIEEEYISEVRKNGI